MNDSGRWTLKSNIAHLYSAGLYRRHKYLATWYPSAAVRLGDIGRLKESLWARESELPPGTWNDQVRKGALISSLEWQNTDKFKTKTKVAGQVDPSFTGLAKADGGIAYTFDKANAIIFHADNIETEEIADTAAIRRWMLEEHREQRLAPETLVVTRVLKAQSCVVLITNSDGARVEMRASAAVAAGRRAMGKLSGNLDIVRATGMFLHMVVQEAVPLFGGIRLRKRFSSQPRVEDVLLGDEPATHEVEAVRDEDDDPFELIGLPE